MKKITGGITLTLLLSVCTWVAPTASGAPTTGNRAGQAIHARNGPQQNFAQSLHTLLRGLTPKAGQQHPSMRTSHLLSHHGDDSVSATSQLHRFSLRARPTRLTPRNRQAAPSALSATDLALPDNLVAPSYASQGYVYSYGGPFRSYHTHWDGFRSGVAAIFNFQPIVTIFYQGSVFSDPSSARSFMAESFNLTASWDSSSPTDCSSNFGVPCEITGFPTSSTSIAVYTVALVNQCVLEVGFEGNAALMQANEQNIARAAAATQVLAIAQAKNACLASSYVPPPTPTSIPAPAASNTPVPPTATPRPTNTPVPAQPSIQIMGFHVLLATSKTKSVETTALKSGLQSGYLIDVNYANAGGDSPTADIAFSLNGKVILARHMQPVSTSARHILFRITDQQVGGAQTAHFIDVEKFTSKKKKVHLAATVQVSLGSAKDTGTVTFTVAPNCKTTKKGKVCK